MKAKVKYEREIELDIDLVVRIEKLARELGKDPVVTLNMVLYKGMSDFLAECDNPEFKAEFKLRQLVRQHANQQ